MRNFGKIESGFWLSKKVKRLSDDAKLLLLYIYTCQHGNSVGCYVLREGYIMGDLGWLSERVTERVTELVTKQVIERDCEHDLILVPGWFEHNSIENGNVATGAAKTILALPHSELIIKLCHVLSKHEKPLIREVFNKLPNTFVNKLANEFPNTLPNGSLHARAHVPEPKPEPEPKPKPEPQPQPEPDGCADDEKTAAPPKNETGKGGGKGKESGVENYRGTQPHPMADEVFSYMTNRIPNLKRVPNSLKEISGWLDAGADPQLDIYPTMEHCLEVNQGGGFGSFKYFTAAILTSVEIRAENAKKAEASRRLVELMAEDERARS